MMIDHLEVHSRSVPQVTEFYRHTLAPLGYALRLDGPTKGFGAGDRLDFFIVEGEPSTDVHYAFAADSRAVVDAAYAAGVAHGYARDRAPALAPHIHPDYYAAYLRDPDGRLIEYVCQSPE